MSGDRQEWEEGLSGARQGAQLIDTVAAAGHIVCCFRFVLAQHTSRPFHV